MLKYFQHILPQYGNTISDTQHVYEYVSDELAFFIVIDNNKYKKVIGSCRYFNNTSREDALKEVGILARLMTVKNILAETGYGGGKSFIYYNTLPRNEMLKKYAEALNELNGRYYVTNDLGISLYDIDIIRGFSPFCKGLIYNGEPIPATAYGVYLAMTAAAQYIFEDKSLSGKSVSIQGIGDCGYPLSQFLTNDNCNLYISEIDDEKKKKLSCRYANVFGDFATEDVDIISPNAIGDVINHKNIDKIKAKLICGAANKQLSDNNLDIVLHNKGILYIPEMLCGFAGMIDLICEGPNYSKDYVLKAVENVMYKKVGHFIETAIQNNCSVLTCVNEYIKQKVLS
jgi:leucine dehydrogenase